MTINQSRDQKPTMSLEIDHVTNNRSRD